MKKSILLYLLLGATLVCSSCWKSEVDDFNKDPEFGEIDYDDGGLVRCDDSSLLVNLDSPFERSDGALRITAKYSLDQLAFEVTIKNMGELDLCDIQLHLKMTYGLLIVNEIKPNGLNINAKESLEVLLADGGVLATGYQITIVSSRPC